MAFIFIVAKVTKENIGADFLNKFYLLIVIHKQKLIGGVTLLNVKSEIMTIFDENYTFDHAS